jgi:hypothetical protein
MAAGCSALGVGGERERRVAPVVLRSSDLARYPAGSPARDFLRWWRELQYNNPGGAAAFYASAVDMTPGKMERSLRFAPSYFHFGTKPEILDVSTQGDSARVRASFRTVATLPNGAVLRQIETRVFRLVREQGIWKQTDNVYVAQLAAFAGNAPPKRGAPPIPDTGTK